MVEVETLYDVEENIDDDNVHEGSARSIGMFNATSIACIFCRLNKCFLMLMMKNFYRLKCGLKIIFGREINYILER